MNYIKITYKDPIYPKSLLAIKNYPKELYIAGNYQLLNKEKKVAIIGSRDCTTYGRKNAEFFAKELSKKNVCIVSGMAIGIDTFSHIGAVEKNGRTIAVLGGGFNKIYPQENEWLFHKILKNCGCIITEYPPNVEAYKENFPKRNRIVSGISDIVLVIEAEYRSGTSITAGYAKEQGKIVCCLPSNIDSKCAIGTNRLIQQGAKLIIKPSEVMDILNSKDIYLPIKYNIKKKEKVKLKQEKIELEEKMEKGKQDKKELDKRREKLEQEIEIPKEYEEIYKLIGNNPIHINDICKMSKKAIQEVTTILTMLELEEYIEQMQGNMFKIKKHF